MPLVEELAIADTASDQRSHLFLRRAWVPRDGVRYELVDLVSRSADGHWSGRLLYRGTSSANAANAMHDARPLLAIPGADPIDPASVSERCTALAFAPPPYGIAHAGEFPKVMGRIPTPTRARSAQWAAACDDPAFVLRVGVPAAVPVAVSIPASNGGPRFGPGILAPTLPLADEAAAESIASGLADLGSAWQDFVAPEALLDTLLAAEILDALRPQLVLIDVLRAGGEATSQLPLDERLMILEGVFASLVDAAGGTRVAGWSMAVRIDEPTYRARLLKVPVEQIRSSVLEDLRAPIGYPSAALLPPNLSTDTPTGGTL